MKIKDWKVKQEQNTVEQYRKLCQKLKEEGEPCGINQPPKECLPDPAA